MPIVSTENTVSLEDIRPFPKAAPKKATKRKLCKSLIWKESPEKIVMERNETLTQIKKDKREQSSTAVQSKKNPQRTQK